MALLVMAAGARQASAAARALDQSGRAIEPSWRAPVVSPDGAHVYTVGSGITLWVRDGGTGRVTFAGVFDTGLGGVESPALSADGAYLYATQGNSVVVFSRNAGTGALALIQQLQDGVGGVDGIADAGELVLSPDGANVYVAGIFDAAVAVFSRNGGTGMLSFVEAEPSGTTSLVMSADGANLYAGDSYSAITVFTRNAGTGALTFLELQTGVVSSNNLSAIAVSPDGAHLYAGPASNNPGSLYGRNPVTGALTFMGSVPGLVLGGSERFLFSADGMFLYDYAYNGVTLLARNAGTGALTYVQGYGGYGSSMALTADGAYLYSGGGSAGAGSGGGLSAFARNAGTGQLMDVQHTALPSPGLVTLSPDGANIYVAGRYIVGSGGATLAGAYTRDPGTGQATFLENYIDGYDGVHDTAPAGTITVSPDGAHVYMTGPKMGIFGRDAGTGRLTFLDGEDYALSVPPSAVAMSADGEFVYTTQLDALAVLDRNPGTGALTLVEVEQDGVAGVDGLTGASSVVLSPDGNHVYVAGAAESEVAVFARSAVTGEVTFLETASSPVSGLVLGTPLAISPDGAHLYVMGGVPFEGRGAIVVFQRTPATGHLTFAGYLEDSQFGVPGIGRPLTVSPDGELLFADTTVFARDASTGSLAFVDVGYSKPSYIGSRLSPDGAHIYTGTYGYGLWTNTIGFAGCDAAPMASCRAAGRSALRIRSTGSVTWKWLKGAATDPGALGDPETTTDYALCVYQGGPALALRALAPANLGFSVPQWVPSGTGFKYRDTWRTPEGLITLKLTPGAAGSAQVRARGAGPHLAVPSLPLSLPVRVQLQNKDGECWESTYLSSPNNGTATFVGHE